MSLTTARLVQQERERRQQLVQLAIEKSRGVQAPPTTTLATGRAPLTVLADFAGNDPTTGDYFAVFDYATFDTDVFA